MTSLLWRSAAFGALWALAVTGSELTVLPVDGYGVFGLLRLFGLLWLLWLPPGIIIAAAAIWAERRIARRSLQFAALVGTTLASTVAWAIGFPLVEWVSAQVSAHAFVGGADMLTRLSYHFWLQAFYGLPFAAALVFVLRAQRHRATWAAAELARIQVKGSAGSAQLHSLRDRVDPALLVGTLEQALRDYSQRSDLGEATLDRLVTYLRAAMPAVRGRAATLRAELQLLESYARLLSATDRAAVVVDVANHLSDGDVVFPRHLLTGLLDRLLALRPRPGALRIAVIPDGEGRATLSVRTAPQSVPAQDLEDWVRSLLATTFGPGSITQAAFDPMRAGSEIRAEFPLIPINDPAHHRRRGGAT